MQQHHDEQDETCPRCKQRPATATYNSRNGKWSVHVCGMCFDRHEIQDAMEWGLVERLNPDGEDNYDAILAWLDTFEEANRHRDHDGWMARSVAASRQHFLWEAERYEESLAACEKVEQLGFEDDWYRYAAGGAKARVLDDMGRHAEALATYEEALRYQALQYEDAARNSMHWLAVYSQNAGKPVDESWREVVQNVAREYEVEFPVRPTLAESILALFEMTENMPSKQQRERDNAQGK